MWFWQITYKIRAIETVLLDLHEIAVAVMKVSGGKLKTKTIDQWEKPDFCNSDKYFRRNYLKKFLEAKIIIEILQKSIREKKMFLFSEKLRKITMATRSRFICITNSGDQRTVWNANLLHTK